MKKLFLSLCSILLLGISQVQAQYYFSVTASTKVVFSPGNLQYHCKNKTWRFAPNQYTVIGAANKNISSTYNGYIDLFGWGTSGWNNGNTYYQPYSNQNTTPTIDELRKNPIPAHYGPKSGSNTNLSLTGTYANADWGVYNVISGYSKGTWRTLTQSEMEYIFKTRTNADKKYSLATVNGVKGMMLLPDNWTLPSDMTFSPAQTNYTVNVYTTAQWQKMEQNGAIFLPAAGARVSKDGVSGTYDVKKIEDVNSMGHYWTSTSGKLKLGTQTYVASGFLAFGSSYSVGLVNARQDGFSVRLVRAYYTTTWTWGSDNTTATLSINGATIEATISESETAATCTVEGNTTYTATAVYKGITYTTSKIVNIAALGHAVVTDEAVAPTCMETGLTEGSHCSRCSAVLVAQNIVDALGHVVVTDEAVAPTCTETGLTEGSHCSRCHATLVAQNMVDALGHVVVTDEAVAPTCTETGLTEGSHCSCCSAVFVTQNTVDALGHVVVTDEAVAPTCTETGLTEGSHCSRCHATLVAQTTVDALGHAVVTDEAVAPTCTESGLTEGSHCSRCHATLVAQNTVDALGHVVVTDEAVAPTCTETGLTEGSHCSRCHAILVAQNIVDALGHVVVTDEAVAPTCTETGLTEGSHCSRCHATLVAQNTVDALGHVVVTDEAVAPTCTETGLTEGSHCSRCHATLVAQNTVDALGHVVVTDEAVAPTCTETGLTEGSHCSRCSAVLVAQNTVDALGHVVVTDEAVAPACTETGLTEGSHCSRCHATLVAQNTVDALGHVVVTDEAIAPTCTETGLTEGSHCSRCHATLVAQNTVDALGHIVVTDEAVEPTCTETGLTEGSHCSRCHATLVAQNTVDALGHIVVTDEAVAPTCTETGLTEGSHCSRCSAILVAQNTVPALGHDYALSEWIWADDKSSASAKFVCSHDASHTETVVATVTSVTTDATCTVDGKIVYTAKASFESTEYTDTKEVTLPALGHVVVTDEAVAPTCTETGLTEGSHCSRCSAILVAQNTVAALGHDYALSEWIWADDLSSASAKFVCSHDANHTETIAATVTNVTTDATCTVDGKIVYTATATFESTEYTDTKEVTLPALGHVIVTDEAVAPTCTETGLTEGSHCSRCSAILVAQNVVAALGHDYALSEWIWADDKSSASAKFVCSHDASHTETVVATVTNVTTDATCTADGKIVYTAKATFESAEYTDTKGVTLSALGHVVVTDEAVAPTCTETGLTEGSHCSRCSAILVAQNTVAALGHDYALSEWIWADDKSSASAKFVCSHDASHTETIVATVTNVMTDATCTVDGKIVYTATATFESAEYTDTKEVTLPALGHIVVTDEAVAPTCTETGLTEGSHCSRCHATLVAQNTVDALGHVVVTDEAVAPTCTETGLTEGSHCSRCSAILVAQNTVAALGHDYALSEWIWADDKSSASVKFVCSHDANHTETVAATVTSVTTDATCTADGKIVYTAKATLESTEYTDTKEVTLPALGHIVVTDEAVAPTCTETGLTEGSHCSRCSAVLVAQNTVDALGHAVVTDEAVAPTCTETGLTEGSHCSRCSAVLVAQNPVDALGHVVVTDEAVAPTCTETGLTEGSHCSRCHATLVAQNTVDALGHVVVTDEAVAPTCTETGLTEGSHCSRCPAVLVAQNPVDALGHVVVTDEAVAPTCTETGLTEGSHCSRCHTTLVAQNTVDALGHVVVTDEAVAPTCTETGLTEGSHCSRCHATLVAQNTVDALGHVVVTDEAVAPTCTETGLAEGSHCSRCSAVLVAQNTVDALGHAVVTDEVVAPTCTETGLTEGSHCSRCSAVLVAQNTVDALGHVVVTDEAIAPTCTETGLTEGSHCSRCHATLVAQNTVDALGHVVVTDEAVAPTCTETGLTEGSHCSRCHATLVAQNTVDALGHAVVTDEAVAPTCTETGLTEGSHCSRCHATLVAQNTVDALGHDYALSEWIWSDDKSSASAKFVCSHDASHTETVAATVTNVTTDATCTEDGKIVYTAKATFESTEYTDTKEVTLPALGHDYSLSEWIWSDDKSSASAKFVCSHDASHTETVAATVTSVTTDATCTADGKIVYTAKATFESTEYTDTKEVTLPALGHDYSLSEWIWSDDKSSASAKFVCSHDASHTETVAATVTSVTTDATCTADGKIVYTAKATFESTEYTDTKEVTLPALGHVVVTDEAVAPTCTEIGLTEGSHCSRCHATLVAQNTVDALGHDYALSEWIWADDLSSASAKFVCSHDAGHTETVAATVTNVTTDAACTEDGEIVYTATVTFESEEYVDTVEVVIPAHGHEFENHVCVHCGMLQEIIGIYVAENPDKTKYILSEEVDWTGLVVMAIYEDSSIAEIPFEKLIIDEVNPTEAGIVAVTLQYEDFDAGVDIEFIEKPAIKVYSQGMTIRIKYAPNNAKYEVFYVKGQVCDVGRIKIAHDDQQTVIPVQVRGLYHVTIEGQTYKVVVK